MILKSLTGSVRSFFVGRGGGVRNIDQVNNHAGALDVFQELDS
jgi:hypothetical protein